MFSSLCLIAVFGCYSKGTSLILRCDPWKWLKNPLFSSTEITLIFITFFAITMGFRTLYSLRKNDSGNVKRMRPKPFWDYFRIFQGLRNDGICKCEEETGTWKWKTNHKHEEIIETLGLCLWCWCVVYRVFYIIFTLWSNKPI